MICVKIIILQGLSFKFTLRLTKEIPKMLCKDKRKRKITEACLKERISYENLYARDSVSDVLSKLA